MGCCVDLVYFASGERITNVGQHRQTAQTGDDLTQQFDPLASRIGGLARQAGDIATRSGQTCNNAGADWIARRREYDRDHCCRLLCRKSRWGIVREDQIDLEPDKLVCDLGKALSASLAPAILNRDIPALDPAQLTQPLHKRGGQMARICHRTRGHHPNGRQLSSLLRPGRERPRRCSPADQRDEVAPPHSITSSVRASSETGTSRPNAFAVLRLMTSSNLSANCTGRFAGVSPFNTRST